MDNNVQVHTLSANETKAKQERYAQAVTQQTNEVKKETEDSHKDQYNNEKAEVKQLVEDFGRKLKKVSLLAPKEMVKESIQEHYSDYVSPALLEKWLNEPQNAPGRVTSSPWPDRIEILNMELLSESVYEVKGEIIEITSLEKAKGGFAGKVPITLIVKRVEKRWLIDDIIVGD